MSAIGKYLVSGLVLLAATHSALAFPDVARMNCSEVKDLAAIHGGTVVVVTGIDRVEKLSTPFGTYCTFGEEAAFFSVATRDDPYCPVYRCQPRYPSYNRN